MLIFDKQTANTSKAYPVPCQTYKMILFAEVRNDYKRELMTTNANSKTRQTSDIELFFTSFYRLKRQIRDLAKYLR